MKKVSNYHVILLMVICFTSPVKLSLIIAPFLQYEQLRGVNVQNIFLTTVRIHLFASKLGNNQFKMSQTSAPHLVISNVSKGIRNLVNLVIFCAPNVKNSLEKTFYNLDLQYM